MTSPPPLDRRQGERRAAERGTPDRRAAKPFLFEADFGAERLAAAARTPSAEERSLADARAEAHAQGVARGRLEGEAAEGARLSRAMEGLAQGLPRLFDELDAVRARAEREAIGFSLAFSRALAGAALSKNPTANLAGAADRLFRNVLSVPRVEVRVSPALAERAREELDRVASRRALTGRVTVIADDAVDGADFRLEWEEGDLARDQGALDAAIAAAVERHTGLKAPPPVPVVLSEGAEATPSAPPAPTPEPTPEPTPGPKTASPPPAAPDAGARPLSFLDAADPFAALAQLASRT